MSGKVVVDKLPWTERAKRQLRKKWILYVMIIPVIAYFLVFQYYPMYGVQLAFKDFKPKLGITGSPWVGFKHFERFFSSSYFWTMIKNTLLISLYQICVGFPLPIIFALLLNYVKSIRLKKTVQMVSYAPHFLSIVVLCSMLSLFCKPDTGIFNVILKLFGQEGDVNFLGKPGYFKHLLVLSGVWQNMGWNAIIYISALAGVDQEMHEAAIIDGATKFQRILHIDLPSIKGTIVMLLIMRIGQVMSLGFEKIYLLQNSLNYDASVTISTYVYEVGLIDGNYSFSTAVSLFNNIINIILLVSANFFSKKVLDESLF